MAVQTPSTGARIERAATPVPCGPSAGVIDAYCQPSGEIPVFDSTRKLEAHRLTGLGFTPALGSIAC